MKYKQIHNKRLVKIFIVLLLLVVTVIGGQVMPAFAETGETKVYTNVIDDLSKDKNLTSKDYPIDYGDYSLQVIQIAESVDGEIFVYVYQPSANKGNLVATDINMSLSKEVTETKLYKLQLINSSVVFYKYLVVDVSVSTEAIRYYNIATIYRAWDKNIDKDSGNNNTLDKKAYPVGKILKAETNSSGVTYTMEPTYVVNIIDPYVDFILYTIMSVDIPLGLVTEVANRGAIDAHYVAFSTDYPINKLMSATVSYSYCQGEGYYNKLWFFDVGSDVKYGESNIGYAYPTYEDKVEKTGIVGFKKYEYKWDRIQTVSNFVETEKKLNEETKTNLNGKQWVLRFLETPRTQDEFGISAYKHYKTTFTKVEKVAILRLEFEAEGRVYNLGAVSNVQTGDKNPGNVTVPVSKEKKTFWQYIGDCFKKAFAMTGSGWEIAVVVIVIILAIVALCLIARFIRFIIDSFKSNKK